jgi:hypothetical protein
MANENGWGDGASNNNIGWGQGAVNNSISWGYLHQTSWAGLTDIYGQSYQPEAASYFTAIEDAGGTLTDNVKAEFDAFVVREKDAGRWGKLKRLYPFLGGKINSAVIDAITLSSATNNNFVDTDADSLIGLQGDGSTKYLRDSAFNGLGQTQFNYGHYWLEITANVLAGDTIVAGSFSSTSASSILYSKLTSASNLPTIRGNVLLTIQTSTTAALTNGGSLASNKTSSTSTKIFLNGAEESEITTTDTGTLPSADLVIFTSSNGAGTDTGRISNAKSGAYAFWTGFTDSDVSGFDTSYKTFINNIQAYAAAQAYFTAVANAGGTLSDNVISEFTSFVSREVEAGRWSKYKVLYPMLGGTLGSVAINAADPSNYNLTLNNFVSGDVDSLQGLTSDGSTKYANLNASVSTFTSTYNIGAYVHQSYIANTQTYEYIFGDRISTSNYLYIAHKYSTFYNTAFGYNNRTDFGSTQINSGDSFGMNKQSSTVYKTYINGSVDKTSSTTDTGSVPVGDLYLFANNFSTGLGYPTAATIDGFTMWTNFTDADVSAFDTSYKTFINNITA